MVGVSPETPIGYHTEQPATGRGRWWSRFHRSEPVPTYEVSQWQPALHPGRPDVEDVDWVGLLAGCVTTGCVTAYIDEIARLHRLEKAADDDNH